MTGCAVGARVEETSTRFLRRPEAGFGLIEQLCYEHYRFSMEACRSVGGAPFVKASTLCLLLIHDYSLGQVGAGELGQRFEAGLATSPELSGMTYESLGELARMLAGRSCPSGAATWAVQDTVEIYVDALSRKHAGASSLEIGTYLIRRFEEWAAGMPIPDAWTKTSDLDILLELRFLSQALLRGEQARSRFSQRLLARFQDDARLARLLAQSWAQD